MQIDTVRISIRDFNREQSFCRFFPSRWGNKSLHNKSHSQSSASDGRSAEGHAGVMKEHMQRLSQLLYLALSVWGARTETPIHHGMTIIYTYKWADGNTRARTLAPESTVIRSTSQPSGLWPVFKSQSVERRGKEGESRRRKPTFWSSSMHTNTRSQSADRFLNQTQHNRHLLTQTWHQERAHAHTVRAVGKCR